MCIVCAGGSSGSGSGIGGAAPPAFNIEQIIAQLDRNNIGWVNGIVTYAFFETLNTANVGDEDYAGFQAFTVAQRQATRDAFDLLADVANLTFIEAADNGASDNRMTFANSTTMPDYVWGWAGGRYYNLPEPQRDQWFSSEIWVNSSGGIGSYAAGTYNFMALMHEIMHGLGVPHPGDYNANADEDITYGTHAEYAQDSRQFTIMSYFGAEATGAQHGFNFGATPLLHDILILQHIYGANMTTRAGDTVYGFNSNAGRTAFDFTLNLRPVIAIWDGAGNDTIDLSGYGTDSIIDLREGGFSSFAGLTNNMAIAYGAVIENAIGGAGNDTLIGNAASNILNGGAGADRMVGGAGDDIYYVDNIGDVVIEANNGGFDTVRTTISFNMTGQYIERLEMLGSANLNVVGNSLNNQILGNDGNNIIDGGTGADQMRGLGGDDIYYVDHAGDRVYEARGGGFDTVRTTVDFNMGGQYIERLEMLGSANLNVIGNSLNNQILGNDGNNIIDGGTGADQMRGLGGDDIYYVDHAGDRVYEARGGGFDTVRTTVDFNMGGQYIERLEMLGSANLNVIGNSLNNQILGNDGNNVIDGGTGADQMRGLGGDDIYYVDHVRDRVYEAAGGGNDTVIASVDFSLAGQYIENLTLTGSATYGTGNSLDNILIGNAGFNVLNGGGGDDILIGGLGQDRLTGGAGQDTFVFRSIQDSTVALSDRITDLQAQDTIDLSAIDADVNSAGDQAFALVDAFTGQAGQATLTFASGVTFLNLDVDGDGVSDFLLRMDGDHRGHENWAW